MYYKIIEKDKKANVTCYRVYEQEMLVAEFAYWIGRKVDRDRESSFYDGNRFWIDKISLFSPFEHFDTMDAILHFIQYKCVLAGYSQIYIKLNARNLFYLELYKRYGFYVIADEGKTDARGTYDHSYVLKYTIPDTKDGMYQNYIRKNFL